MKHMKKLVSIFLSLALAWNLASPAFASDNAAKNENSFVDSQTQKLEDASFYETASISSYTAKDVLWEEEDRREESVKHFRMTDGSFLAVEYGEPVHVLDRDGTYVEIDNSLSLDSKAAFTAANSMIPVRFAESTCGEALVQIGNGDNLFSMTPYTGLSSRGRLNGTGMGGTDLPAASAENVEALRALPVMDTAQVSARINNSISEKSVSDSASVEEATRPGHIYSSVQYSKILPFVDLEYVLTPTALKENIVINRPRSDYRFTFTLSLGEMKPELNKDGSVSVFLNGELTYFIPAPFMFDASGAISQDVHYTLTEYGHGNYILTVDPDKTWINSKERLFPVTIDPNVTWKSGQGGVSIDSSYITSFYPDYPMGNTSTYVGRGYNGTSYGIYRAFYKLRQYPSIPNNSTIIGATLSLRTMNYSGFDEINMIATAVAPIEGISGSDFSVTGLTWNTCPELETEALDYAVFRRKGGLLTYSWNITRKLIDWYDNPDSNYGLMLSAKDEETLAAWVQFYPTGSVYPPSISVSYRNNVGLEPYYTCRSIDMGRAGTAYLGDYSGALTAMKTDVYASSTTNPVGLNHVYHSDLARVEYTSYLNGAYASMRLGAGWQLDCMESVSRDGNYVCYFDGDGTLHMFQYNRAQQAYVDEDGLGLTIKEVGANTNRYDLSDRYGNQKRFEGGLLQYYQDKQGNRVNYHYENGQLTSITRQNDHGSAEQIATLRYDINLYLASITDSASNTTAFSYTSSNGLVLLSTITHPDGTTVSFTYHENGKLHTVTDNESGLRYEFSYAAQSGKVSMIRQFSGETLGLLYGANGSYAGIQAYRYAGANRTFSSSDYMTGGNQDDDTDDILTFFVFDSTGCTINSYVTDYKKETIYSATANKYSANDNIDPRKNNRVTLQSGLNLLAENRLPENPEPGSNGGWTLSSGATYDESTQMLRFTGDPTKTVKATKTIFLENGGKGSYILSAFSKAASVPLSESDGKTWGLRAKLFYNVGTGYQIQSKTKEYEISYAADSTSWQYLMLPICVPQEEVENASVYRIDITLEYGKNLNEALFTRVSLVPGVSQSYGYSDEGDVTGVSTTDMAEVTYTYDSAGYVTSQNTPDRGEILYNYDDEHNLIEMTNNGVIGTYTYDDAGNPTGTVLSAAGYGKQIVTAAAYDANGNRVLTETDARGNSTQYAYSNAISRQTGNPSKVTNANNTVVNYTYNAQNGRITCAAIPSTVSLDYAYSGGRLSTLTRKSYTGTTQKIQRYYLNYDPFGNLTGVSVGASAANARLLVSHSYADNNGVLAQTNYPNGTTVNYTYDTLERVTETRYNNSVAAEYAYDANGELGTVRDRRAGRFYSYAYDSLGRLVQAIQYSGINAGGTALTEAGYQYDAAGRLAQQSLAINPYVMELSGSGSQSALDLKLDNAYGTDGTLSATQIRAATRVVTTPTFPPQNGIGQDVVSQQSVLLRYSYDALQRPSSVELSSGGSGGSLITTEYAYLSGSAAERTTPLIASVNTSVKGSQAVTLEYSYDALGNITKISGRTLSGSDTASYRYDVQSQLTRETLSDRSYVYTYDTAGNILSKKETRGGTTTTHTYTYGNSQWKDLLTKYDGVTVTYDAIGNPLKYRGMTFTWANGRELRSARKGGIDLLYTYGVDGLRTQKTVGDNEIHSYGWSGGRLVYERVGASAYSTMGTGSTQGTQGAQKVLTPPAASAYDRTLYFLYDASGSPIGFILREGSGLPQTYYYVKNLQGDVLGIIDGGGNVKAAYRYNAWGEILSATGELAELNPLRYRGYYYDSETGLYYLQSRYYDPVVGRFLNADAVPMLGANGDFIGYNLFAYCGNNPVDLLDLGGYAIEDALHNSIGASGIGFGASYTPWIISALLTAISFVFCGETAQEQKKAPIFSPDESNISIAIEKSFAISKEKTYRSTNELHHIVAQTSVKAAPARAVLEAAGISVNQQENLVLIKTGLHRRLHTNLYYEMINVTLVSAYSMDNGNTARQNVLSAMNGVRTFITLLNTFAPF